LVDGKLQHLFSALAFVDHSKISIKCQLNYLKQRTRMEEDYSIKFIKIYLFP
jgi:hypothetical protein